MVRRNILRVVAVLLLIVGALAANCPIEIPRNIKFKSGTHSPDVEHIILSTQPGAAYQLNPSSSNQRFDLQYDDSFSRQPRVALGKNKILTQLSRGSSATKPITSASWLWPLPTFPAPNCPSL